jgi:hypothetical protein
MKSQLPTKTLDVSRQGEKLVGFGVGVVGQAQEQMFWFYITRARLLSFPSSKEDCSSRVLSVSFEHL